MAENGSGNTAIVAIVVIVVLALAVAYYFGVFGQPKGSTSTTTIIEAPKIIESN